MPSPELLPRPILAKDRARRGPAYRVVLPPLVAFGLLMPVVVDCSGVPPGSCDIVFVRVRKVPRTSFWWVCALLQVPPMSPSEERGEKTGTHSGRHLGQMKHHRGHMNRGNEESEENGER